jgi:hypothetical protein
MREAAFNSLARASEGDAAMHQEMRETRGMTSRPRSVQARIGAYDKNSGRRCLSLRSAHSYV